MFYQLLSPKVELYLTNNKDLMSYVARIHPCRHDMGVESLPHLVNSPRVLDQIHYGSHTRNGPTWCTLEISYQERPKLEEVFSVLSYARF